MKCFVFDTRILAGENGKADSTYVNLQKSLNLFLPTVIISTYNMKDFSLEDTKEWLRKSKIPYDSVYGFDYMTTTDTIIKTLEDSEWEPEIVFTDLGWAWKERGYRVLGK